MQFSSLNKEIWAWELIFLIFLCLRYVELWTTLLWNFRIKLTRSEWLNLSIKMFDYLNWICQIWGYRRKLFALLELILVYSLNKFITCWKWYYDLFLMKMNAWSLLDFIDPIITHVLAWMTLFIENEMFIWSYWLNHFLRY